MNTTIKITKNISVKEFQELSYVLEYFPVNQEGFATLIKNGRTISIDITSESEHSVNNDSNRRDSIRYDSAKQDST